MTNALIESIENSLVFLPKAEARVAAYVLENRESVTRMSVKELADACDSSVATVVRFSRRMGAEGYTDFKIQLSAALVARGDENIELSNIGELDPVADIFAKVSSYAIKSIRDTQHILDTTALEQAVDLLDDANRRGHRVFVYGMGASSFLAEQAQFELTRLGFDVAYNKDLHLFFESLFNITPDDVFLCLSTLGRSTSTQQALEMARSLGAHIILISQYGNKVLEGHADIALLTSNIECDRRLVSATAHIIEGMVIHTLFFGLAVRNYSKHLGRMAEIRELFKEFGYMSRSAPKSE